MGSMIEARKRYHNAYQTEHYKTVSVTVNRDKDADVLARLTEQKNVSGYVRELVKRDIALKEAIERVPTVDAVEVVRCKDCVYFWDGVCTAHTDAICTDENEFCSWGERR